MNILYLHQHFALPSGSTGTRSYEFAKRWVEAGHQVTVICGCYDIGGLEYFKRYQLIDGIKIIITGMKYSNKMGFLKRVLSFLSFMFFSFTVGLRQKSVDIIFATSTPLTIGISAMLLKWFKKKPFVFEVRDEWPRIPIEMGIVKNKILIKFLYWLEGFIYKQSAGIVALSPGMAEGIRDSLGKTERSIVVASNSSDINRFKPEVDSCGIREKHGWNGKIVFLHAGAMSSVNNLDFVIEVAKKLQKIKGVHFVLIGEGNHKNMLKEKIRSLDLTNIEILDSVSKEDIPVYFGAADVGLVIIGNYSVVEHNSANKFFDSLSAGKPVLLNYSGWQREIIENAHAGYGCKRCDIDEFTSKVIYLYKNKLNLKNLGQNARKLAETEFSRDIISNKVLNFVCSCVKE